MEHSVLVSSVRAQERDHRPDAEGPAVEAGRRPHLHRRQVRANGRPRLGLPPSSDDPCAETFQPFDPTASHQR